MAELNNLATIGKWMIYGAYGYTGKLVVEEAVKRGHLPVIAGQNEEKVLDLAEQYNLPFRVFPLDHPRKIKSHLADVGVVLNCAGPFSQTAKPLREACIDCGVHYLDITGEIEVLEESYQSHPAAREAGVVVISGVGFDVVPTDMLASLLKEQLPTATHLELAFAGGGWHQPRHRQNHAGDGGAAWPYSPRWRDGAGAAGLALPRGSLLRYAAPLYHHSLGRRFYRIPLYRYP
jgi:short subunit dehydrogenase-like uncharacterized protein